MPASPKTTTTKRSILSLTPEQRAFVEDAPPEVAAKPVAVVPSPMPEVEAELEAEAFVPPPEIVRTTGQGSAAPSPSRAVDEAPVTRWDGPPLPAKHRLQSSGKMVRRLTGYVSPELGDQLDAFMTAEQRTTSWVLERALREWLARQA